MKFNSSYVSTNYLIIPEVYTFTNTLNPVRAYSYSSNLLLLSAYYSLDLTYKKYFTVSTTGRLDKTSALTPDNNTGFYPSVTLSTVVSDNITLPKAISLLKLRGSYANVKGGGTNAYVGTAFQSLGVGSPLGYGNNYYTPYDGPAYNTSTPSYATTPGYDNKTQANTANYSVQTGIKPFRGVAMRVALI